MTTIKLYKRTEKRKAFAFISPVNSNGPHFGEVEVPIQTAEGEALRRHRVCLGVTLRDATTACGFTKASDYSGLETGEYTTDQWDEVYRALESAPRNAPARDPVILELPTFDEDRVGPCICGTERDDGECMQCAQKACPHGEPLHWHHDGCPACDYIPDTKP